MPITYCPNCGQDALLKEKTIRDVVFVACELCEWSFYITDAGDIDTDRLGRMQTDVQIRYERERKGIEPAKEVLRRMGYRVMEEPPRTYPGQLAYVSPNDYERGRRVV